MAITFWIYLQIKIDIVVGKIKPDALKTNY